MAFIQNTAFEVKISNHEFDSIANITGTYMNASDAAEVVSSRATRTWVLSVPPLLWRTPTPGP